MALGDLRRLGRPQLLHALRQGQRHRLHAARVGVQMRVALGVHIAIKRGDEARLRAQ